MPNTPRGYPYPDPVTGAPDVPYDLQRLASAVDSDVTGLQADTGWVTSGLTYRSGWGPTSGYTPAVRKLKLGGASLVLLRGALTYSSGSVTGVGLVSLPAGYRPESDTFMPGSNASGGAMSYALLVQAGGWVMVPSGYHAGTAPVGMVVPLFGTWVTTQ